MIAAEPRLPETTMTFPAFFAEAPTITVRDPLAGFLGAAADGTITYSYADAVKLAGHSCPTVAGAFLMVGKGLAGLYGTELPERGGLEVFLRGDRDEGTTGVIASVATLITGAAPETGFGGIGRRFARRDLLHFGSPIDGLLAIRRRDTGEGVVLDLDTAIVPPDPASGPLFSLAVSEQADAVEQAQFATLWQDRVARMLAQPADSRLVRMAAWPAPAQQPA